MTQSDPGTVPYETQDRLVRAIGRSEGWSSAASRPCSGFGALMTLGGWAVGIIEF